MEGKRQKAGETRASDALLGDRRDNKPPRDEPEIEIDARFTTSGNEVFRRMDFAQMSAAEIALAGEKNWSGCNCRSTAFPLGVSGNRMFTGQVDPRATMRSALRTGGSLILPRYRQQKEIQPPLVVLADISGSMSQYTRIFLHFLHVLTERRRRVHTFLFGTRLTNVTRQMRHKRSGPRH